MSLERRSPDDTRIELRQQARLTTTSGERLDVSFKDLSRVGFKIGHAQLAFSVGQLVLISTKRSTARAQIVWTTDRAAGGTFLDPPDPALD